MAWDRDVVTSFEDWFDYDRDGKLNIFEETEMYESMEREYKATMDSLSCFDGPLRREESEDSGTESSHSGTSYSGPVYFGHEIVYVPKAADVKKIKPAEEDEKFNFKEELESALIVLGVLFLLTMILVAFCMPKSSSRRCYVRGCNEIAVEGSEYCAQHKLATPIPSSDSSSTGKNTTSGTSSGRSTTSSYSSGRSSSGTGSYSSSGSHSSSGSYSGSGSSGSSYRRSSGGSTVYNTLDFDPDDYDTPEDYADDAWGVDFDDWDDAYDYWEDY